MAQETQTTQSDSVPSGRGPGKPYPPLSFEEALPVAKAIVSQGLDDRLRRGTLFEHLERSPDSSRSRTLLSASIRYGLTTGSYRAEFVTVTEIGKTVAREESGVGSAKRLVFDCAIGKFEPFQQLYEKLKERRVPSESVLCDELAQLGVSRGDCKSAAGIFLANASFVGIIRESQAGGGQRVISIEQVLEEIGSLAEEAPMEAPASSPPQDAPVVTPAQEERGSPGPSLHIDVQVHIDSSATSEQIDQIFASMAKHLYGKDG